MKTIIYGLNVIILNKRLKIAKLGLIISLIRIILLINLRNYYTVIT